MAYIPSIKRNLIQYLFWIDLDIVFFLEFEKLNYTEIHYCLELEYFVGVFTD